jgi:alpha-tubulin suppressor-like RCC1 family protein
MIVSNGVVAVAAGAYTSFFIRSDGSLWAMGLRSDGNLADGTTNDFPWNNYTNTPESLALVTQRTPELIVSNGVTAVNLSSLARVYFWKNDGSLWGAGANWEGELTPGGAVKYYSPVPVAQSNVVAIAGGFYFSVFLKSDETLWKVGWTWWQPDETPNIIATDVVSSAAYGDNDVNDIFFIKSDGSLWGMGDNAEGQLGDGTTAEHTIPFEIVSNGVVAVATIGDETWFLKSDGSLWGMGWNGYGDLGDGTTIQRDSPVLIVPPPPVIINLNVAGTDLIFQVTNGMAGRDYSVLMSTNLAPPPNAWLPITTNMLVTDGGFTITVTNAFNQNVPPHFYTLRLNQ